MEGRLGEGIDGATDNMEKRISTLETRVQRKIERHGKNQAKGFMNEMDELKETMQGIDQGGWKTPFLILMILVGGAGIMGYRHYRKLIKSHLL